MVGSKSKSEPKPTTIIEIGTETFWFRTKPDLFASLYPTTVSLSLSYLKLPKEVSLSLSFSIRISHMRANSTLGEEDKVERVNELSDITRIRDDQG